MKKYLCIHGHFYQPPRENPWLEHIEVQDLAAPFHDWNDRINAECYAPNRASRILSKDNKIIDIVNNYLSMSFNFGPTLLSWIEQKDHVTYENIINADKESINKHSGHGNALSQVYNHMILPLAEEKDRATQVKWGIEDFKHRFNREPEGMWLAETAVNTDVLEVLVDHNIKFTILSPFQAKNIRKLSPNNENWIDVNHGKIDPSRGYLCKLKNGKSIAIFFYDAIISQAVAFEGLLNSGLQFGNRLLQGYSDKRNHDQLLHIATDGETYGHHFKFGEMALSFAIQNLVNNYQVTLTNYAEFLHMHPPEYEVEIHENSSWSCFHGVERWRSDCGCRINNTPNWNQAWRKELRNSLNWLKEQFNNIYEREISHFLIDPWKARDDYIHIILNRSTEQINQFFQSHQNKSLNHDDRVNCLKLLELQHQGMLMFTSCGWFFDDISGIETVQILKHASRGIQFASQFAYNLEDDFVNRLVHAKSNILELNNGKEIYYRFVKPAQVDLKRVIAHYAISSIMPEYDQEHYDIDDKEKNIYSYTVKPKNYEKCSYGSANILIGKVDVTSNITLESEEVIFAALHFGHHDFQCKIGRFLEHSDYGKFKSEIINMFNSQSLTQVILKLEHSFPGNFYSLKDLFVEERRKILSKITEEIFKHFQKGYFKLYKNNKRLMEYHLEMDVPINKEFQKAANFVLSSKLHDAIIKECNKVDEKNYIDEINEIIKESNKWYISLELDLPAKLITKIIKSKMTELYNNWSNKIIIDILHLLDLSKDLNLPIKRWYFQNDYYKLYKQFPNVPENEKEDAKKLFFGLAQHLDFQLT
ncbi:MAG: DUF3536 domain-containing protein [Spirochaetota bacterium]|nr:DUF3536 domain-containing protein [Spirochaetota bacterium]